MEDALHGFWDNVDHKYFLNVLNPEITYEPYDSQRLLFKASFNLSEKSTYFYRRSYTFMDALGDIGGLLEALIVVTTFLVSPFYSNMQIYHLFENIKHKSSDLKDIDLSFKVKFLWFLKDTFKGLTSKIFRCADWDSFDKI